MHKTSHVLVPVCGNPTDGETISLACRMVKGTKGKVSAICIIEVKRVLPLDADLEPEIQKAEAVLDHAEQIAEELDFEIGTEILQAREVGPAVVDEAIERGADLIIIGIPYKKRFGEFNMGRCAPYVLKNAPCRVWIVREAVSGDTA